MTNQLFRELLDNKIPGHQTPTFAFIEIHPNTDTFVEALHSAAAATRTQPPQPHDS